METTDNKKDKNTAGKKQPQEEHPSVTQGRAAIKAARLANPEPDEVQEQKEREDAEKWRNEG